MRLVVLALLCSLTLPAAAANTPKIKYIRVNQGASNSRVDVLPDGRVYRLAVTTTGEVPAASQVRAEYGKEGNRVRTVRNLRHERTDLRASVPVFVGDLRAESILATLELRDAGGRALFTGTARFGGGVVQARWDGTYTDGKQPGFWTGAAELFATTTAGDVDFAFSIGGEKADAVVAATLKVVVKRKDGYHLASTTELAAGALLREHTFSTDVLFSGDPVGSEHELELRIDVPESPAPIVEKATIRMVQLPGDEGAPGPILGITANGSGTRSSASNTQQTQQAQLL